MEVSLISGEIPVITVLAMPPSKCIHSLITLNYYNVIIYITHNFILYVFP
jgi:hypothetical protein